LKKNKIKMVSADKMPHNDLVGCGRSEIGADICIVNPETCIPSAEDEVGEIWVKSKSVARGYWQRPRETKETFQAAIANSGEGPFLRTGDLGFILDGELYITGRIKDMIIIQGRNFYPQDIELTVERSHPALRPSCGAAFAVEDKNVERLVIVQEVNRELRNKSNLNEAINSIRLDVAKDHGLRAHVVVLIRPGTIRKTTSGKIQRRTNRDAFLANEFEILAEWRAPQS